MTSDDEPINAPERVWLAPDLGDDWSILKVGDAIYWEGVDRHHPDDCETEYVRADIAEARIRELEAELDSLGDLSEWEKVCAGTHVVVPVDPTDEMAEAGDLYSDYAEGCYRAMIRTAQPDKQQQGE